MIERVGTVLAAVILLVGGSEPALAQWSGANPSGPFELADSVQVDLADNAVLAQLERVKTLLADRQWDEAVEILRQLVERSEGKLLAVGPRRYVGLSEACQRELATLPAEALKLYRGRVDPVVQKWYERGIARRDRRLLQEIVDQAFASSYGDDALWALGEMAFESGDYAAARWDWQRIVPVGNKGSGVRGQGSGARVQHSGVKVPGSGSDSQSLSASAWPAYPDSKLDLAAVRARLVLASILEEGTRNGAGTFSRARAELAEFARLHPDAHGRLGNREGKYVDLLVAILAEGASWPAEAVDSNWSTFAGNPRRNKIAIRPIDMGAVAWRVPLGAPVTTDLRSLSSEKTIGENSAEPLSFYPLVVGQLALLSDGQQILALRRDTGAPAWGQTAAIFQTELSGVAAGPRIVRDSLGSPRFTMTVFQDRLVARMGSAITGQAQGATTAIKPGYLVCLDLSAQGRLLWKRAPEEGWAFEGAPVADQHGMYVGMRRQDIRPQAAVACFETETGQLRWRRTICSAETPAHGTLPEYTHNLLTLSGGMIFCNTNLGAVAALRVEDGRIVWLSLYPRALTGDLARLAPHWHRDLNPCVLDGDALLVAPADSPRIFAFDAFTGGLLWQTGTEIEDAAALLGTAGDWLIAGGGRLYWISLRGAERGRARHVWPDGPDRPGYGRGVLAGQSVLWPTRDKLYIFDQQSARLQKVVDLAARGAQGGNLCAADGQLLIATENELIALGIHGGKAHDGGQL